MFANKYTNLKMGVNNCSCISNNFCNSDAIKSDKARKNSNHIISTNFPYDISKVTKLQMYFKRYLHRIKETKPTKLFFSRTFTSSSFSITDKTSILQSQLDNLFNQYSPLKDGIKVSLVQLYFQNQAEYSGEWNPKLQERHGRGIQLWIDKTIYIGQWKNDKIHGLGKIINPSSGYYEGSFVNAHAEGYGVYVHNNGCTYKGFWKRDLQEGKGKETWPNNLEYEGEYKGGKKNGQGRLTLNDGSVYIGSFFNNKIEGYGVYKWSNKCEYKGEFKNNKMEGEGVFAWPDGRKYKGHYFNDKKNGFGEFQWPNGKIYRGHWLNGKQNGEGVIYDPKMKRWKKGYWNEGRRVQWDDKTT